MPPSVQLTYFNLKDIGEPIRLLLAYGGIEFKDVRVSDEEWPQMKDCKYYECATESSSKRTRWKETFLWYFVFFLEVFFKNHIRFICYINHYHTSAFYLTSYYIFYVEVNRWWEGARCGRNVYKELGNNWKKFKMCSDQGVIQCRV